MFSSKSFSRVFLAAAISAVYVTPASAALISGTLYYTNFTGGQNVNNITYSYDDVTHTFGLGAANNLASTNGADGIIFAPNGNLLIGGQGSGNVYEVNPNNGNVVHTQFTGNPSFHLTLNPNGNSVYTSDFGGALHILSLPIGSGSATQSITGSERGLTQIAFGNNGAVFYVNGNPNGFGNLGTIDLSTGVTTQLHSGVQPAHGLIYDPFTNLITMFGAGETGTMNATNGSGLLTSGGIFQVSDFDQGAIDGKGHALVAGSGAITFIDYSISHDITHPDFTTTRFGFNGIDDVAPLTGAGSNPNPNPVPEPGTIALLGLGLAGLYFSRRKQA
jgi:hypothetical protein